MSLGCCCRCRKQLPPVDVWENVTKVAAYPDAADTTPIAPYARPWYEWSEGACVPASDPPATCGGSDQAVCFNYSFDGTLLGTGSAAEAALMIPEGIAPCDPAPGETVDSAQYNCYRKSATTADLSNTCPPGWKGVTAVALWPGRFDFESGNEDGTACCNTGGQEQTKYRELRYSNVASFSDIYDATIAGNPQSLYRTQTHDYQQTATVDRHGNVARTGYKNASLTVIDDGVTVTEDSDNCNGGPGTTGSLGLAFDETISVGEYEAFIITIYSGEEDFNTNCGWTSPTIPVSPGDVPDIEDTLLGEWTADLTTDSFNASFVREPTRIVWSYSGQITVQYYSTGTNPDLGAVGNNYATRVYTWNQVITFELGQPLTFADVLDDAKILLDEFPLHDDAVYPWRTDAKTWLQPLLYRDAAVNFPEIDWTVDANCEFINSGSYTGEIRGVHLPAGYNHGAAEGHFSFTHINWVRNYDGVMCDACEQSVGAFAASPLPMTTTAWTNYEEGSWHCGPGAHVQQIVDYNYQSGSAGPTPIDGVRVTKWAETLDRWPAINLMRPFGDDRWRIDMTKASCIAAEGPGALEITTDTDISAGLSAGDLVAIYGGSAPGTYTDQIWRITSATGTSIILDAQIDVPTAFLAAVRAEWADHGEWGLYGVIGKLRWQGERNGDGIEWPWQRVTGRHATITVDATDTYKLTIPTGTQLISGDKVDLLDASNAPVVTAYYKRLTDTAGEIYSDLALTTPEDGTGAVRLRGHEDDDPPNQSWDTDASRNTVIVRTWESKIREAASPDLTEEQFTLTRRNNAQCVFCVSPNSQDTTYFENNNSGSLVQTWDNTIIEADMCYGKEWHRDCVQAINDPFWQAPDVACVAVTQEAYPCEDAALTYKYPPLVEPLLLLPTTGDEPLPTLPADVTLHEVGAMPAAVGVGGATACPSAPNDRATVHNVRVAWEACDDWEDMVNHGL